MYQKRPRVRSESYRRYVASKDCFGCGVAGFSQAAHANNGKGLGMKTCDLQTFPLCAPHWGLPGCHYQHDNLVGMDRDTRRELEVKYVAQMQEMARADGRREFKAAA